MRRLAGAFLLVALAACKRAPPMDDRPIDDVPEKELELEKERIEKGETVGDALRAPRIEIDAVECRVNGHHVAARADFTVTGTTPRRVELLFECLKGLRLHWKTIHPARDFVSLADVTVPDDLTFAEGASVVESLTSAGFVESVSLHSGTASVLINLRAPGPSHGDCDGCEGRLQSEVFLWDATGSGGWTARVAELEQQVFGARYPWMDPRSCEPTVPVSLTTVAGVLGTQCKRGCAGFTIGGAARFHDAIAMLAAAFRAPTGGRAEVEFTVEPCGKGGR